MEVRTYKVIYDLLDDMRAAMEGQLRSVEERIPLGAAEVRRRLANVSTSKPLVGDSRVFPSTCACGAHGAGHLFLRALHMLLSNWLRSAV